MKTSLLNNLLITTLSLIVFTDSMAAQEEDQAASIIVDQSGSVHPWSHLEVNNDPDNFQFAIVTDRTGGHRAGVFMDAINKLNLLGEAGGNERGGMTTHCDPAAHGQPLLAISASCQPRLLWRDLAQPNAPARPPGRVLG